MRRHVPRCAPALCAASFTAMISAAALAGDLLIGGAPGEVWKSDSTARSFSYFTCTCNGPIQGAAQDGDWLYVGDQIGMIVKFNLGTGSLFQIFAAPEPITAVAMHDGDLLVSALGGAIRRIDTDSGDIIGTLTAPIQVEAMAVSGDRLFVAGPSGDIWSAPLPDGAFTYFACACFPNVRSLAAMDGRIYAGTEGALVLKIHEATGAFESVFFLPSAARALVVEGGDLLAATADSRILRLDPADGFVKDQFATPFAAEALVSHTPSLRPIDVNDDGAVNTVDLGMVLGSWGLCFDVCPTDFNRDGTVNHIDLAMVLGAWTS